MDTILQLGSAALKKTALNEQVKQYLIENKPLFQLLKRAADRYIGGETLEETVAKVIRQNKKGFPCSIDFIGESTRTLKEVEEATDEIIRVCKVIQHLNLRSSVSLDLSHIGLAISEELCYQKLMNICGEADAAQSEVIISAEGLERTDAVLDMYKKGVKEYPKLGITLQAFLYRTKDDLIEALKEPGRIRIVKGAYAADPQLALPRGSALDEAYLGYVSQILAAGHLCSIATHHDKMMDGAKTLITHYQCSDDTYEFESLYGIRTDLLEGLKDQGYPTRMYFIYGKEWFLYLCNRLSEYPMHLFQALSDMVG